MPQSLTRPTRAPSGSFRSLRAVFCLAAGLLAACPNAETPQVIAAIAVSPARLTLETTIAAPPSQYQARIVNGADGTLQDLHAEISYVSGIGWLQATLSTTTATRTELATLQLTITPGGLPLGTYQAVVAISSANASNSPHHVIVILTVKPRPPTQLALLTPPSAASPNGAPLTVQPVLQLRNVLGEDAPVANIPVTVAISPAGAVLTGTLTVNTNANGRATFTDLAILGATGNYTLTFSSPGLSSPPANPITVNAGTASRLKADAPLNQNANAGTAVTAPPAVIVTDQSDNPVAGIAINFVAQQGTIAPAGGMVVTNAAGRAALTSWTLKPAVGANALSASTLAFTAAPINFSATGVTGPSALLAIVSGDNLSAQVGTTLGTPHVVRVTDAFQNPVQNVNVAWAAASGGGSVAPAASTTDAQGLASAIRTLGPGAGNQTTTASATLANGPALVTFNISAGPGGVTQLIKVAGDLQSGPVGSVLATPLSVRARDVNNNAVPNAVVSWTTTNPGGGFPSGVTSTTDATGLATATWRLGTVIGPQAAQAAVGGPAPVGFTATATAGVVSASQSSVSANPPSITASTGASLSTITVTARDASGNPISGATVVLAATGGGNALTQPGLTNGAGVATGTLSSTLSGAKTVSVTINGVAITQTAVVTVSAGAAANIAASSATAFSVRFNQPVSPLPTVIVTDPFGNAVQNHLVTFAVTLGSGTLGGAAQMTSLQGLASPGSWSLNPYSSGVAGTINVYNRLTATAAGPGITGNPVTFTGTANVFHDADLPALWQDNCVGCHDSHQAPLLWPPSVMYANIRTATYVDVTAPFDSSLVNNYLLRKIKSADPTVHSGGKFPDNIVTIIAAWIIQGSPQ